MKNNNFLLRLVITVLVTFHCTLSKGQTQIQGVYSQKKNENLKLKFEGNKFLFIDSNDQIHSPSYDCCDTIAYGYWENDRKGLIKLYSDPKLFAPVPINVQEAKVESDSILFFISNPIEDYYERTGRKVHGVVYRVDVDSDQTGIENSLRKYFDTNRIVISNPGKGKIRTISISVIPRFNFGGRNIGTREALTVTYEVKNTNSNVYEISVPQMNYGYLTYMRLNDDYVKVISKKKLVWNGATYELKE